MDSPQWVTLGTMYGYILCMNGSCRSTHGVVLGLDRPPTAGPQTLLAAAHAGCVADL